MRQKMQNPNLDREWFLNKLDEQKYTVRGLAKLMDLDPSSVSLMLRGIRAISPEESVALGDLFNVTPQEILKRAGAPLPDECRTIKITAYTNGDGKLHAIDLDAQDEFRAPFDSPVNAYAIQSRAATLIDGWVYVAHGTRRDPAELVGKLVVYGTHDGQQRIGFLSKGYKQGTYNATHYITAGPERSDNVNMLWASEILWVKP